MSNSGNNQSGGITFLDALGLLFIGLKLGHVLAWSWWWVTVPLWGGLALVAAVGIPWLIVAALIDAVAALRRRRAIEAARSNPAVSRRTPISGRKDIR
jgi:hypothetical protein